MGARIARDERKGIQMASMNKVILMGNLTKDPESRTLPSGTVVADMRMALNESFTDRNGKKVERVCYVDVAVWEKQAEACAKYLAKGSPVLVEGRLEFDEWKTKEGETRNRLKVRADRVQFISSPRGRDGGERQQPEDRRQDDEERRATPPPDKAPDDLPYNGPAPAKPAGQQSPGAAAGADEDPPF